MSSANFLTLTLLLLPPFGACWSPVLGALCGRFESFAGGGFGVSAFAGVVSTSAASDGRVFRAFREVERRSARAERGATSGSVSGGRDLFERDLALVALSFASILLVEADGDIDNT